MAHRTAYVTQRAPIHQDVARASCPEQLDLVMLVSPSTSEIVDAVSDAEFLVSERSRVIDASIIEAGRGLRLIQRLGLQIHDIDLDAARRARIPVCRWPLRQCTMVAEHVVMQIMALLKRTREAAQIVAESSDEWGAPQRCDADTFLIDWSKMSGVRQLRDCTVGIVGLGEIGTELALRLGSFGCELLYYRRNRLPSWAEDQLQIAYAGLDDLLGRSDVLVLLLPHSTETACIVDAAFLSRLRAGPARQPAQGPGRRSEGQRGADPPLRPSRARPRHGNTTGRVHQPARGDRRPPTPSPSPLTASPPGWALRHCSL